MRGVTTLLEVSWRHVFLLLLRPLSRRLAPFPNPTPRNTSAHSPTSPSSPSPSSSPPAWGKLPFFYLFTAALVCATLLSPATATTYACLDGSWTAGSVDNSVPFRCYKRITGTWMWSQGNSICDSEASGATLAEFQSPSEFDAAYKLCTPRTATISNWCWTGVYSDPGPTNRTCCWKFGNGGDPTWLRSNGGTVWASSEPNNASGAQYCAALGYLVNGMDDTECNNGMGVMCSVLAVAASPSPTPSNSPTASPTSSPTASPTPSTSQSPSTSPTPSVSPSPSPSATRTPSTSPTPSPSPSNVPVLTVVQNVTAVIDNQLPTISISAPTTTAAGAESLTVGVTSSFQNLQVGSNTPATLEASDVTVRVEDRPASTDPESSATVQTHIYRSVLPATTTTLEQSFAFHNQSAQGQFAQIGFSIGSSTLKWSINVTGASSEQLTVRYRLATLGSSAADAIDSSQPVIVRPSLPRANMTTYFFTLLATSSSSASTPSSSRITAKVEVFDVALVDGLAVPLVSHSVVLVNVSAAQPEYLLELTFPAFAHSLFYDPSISMGVLLNSRDESTSSDDSSLVIAVAVAVPVALLVVVIAAAAATVWTKIRRTRVRERVRQQTLAFNMTTL